MNKIKSLIIHAPRCTLTYNVGEIDNWVDEEVKTINIFVDKNKVPVYAEILYKKSKQKTTFYGFPMMIVE